MNYTKNIGALIALACGSIVSAGDVQWLAAGDSVTGLSGTDNQLTPELIGVVLDDSLYNFSIFADPEGIDETVLYEGTFMTRVVRSFETGKLTFNYLLTESNSQLAGLISHIEISGYAGWESRVEYRNDATAPGDEGPSDASRSSDGNMIDFDFGTLLDSGEDSRFFFVMTDAETFNENISIATVYLQSGESVSFDIGAVPTPGALGLLSIAGLITARRRR